MIHRNVLRYMFVLITVLTLIQFPGVSHGAGYDPPAGKNLLDPSLFYESENVLYSIVPVAVEGGESYIFSMPLFSGIDFVYITIDSDQREYVDEDNLTYDVCTESIDYLICLIEVHPDDDTLSFSFEGALVGLYFSMYGMEYFQLEQGETRTAYAPFESTNVVTVHQGQGTLTTSYETVLTLSEILHDYVSATDDYDGDLSEMIVIEDDPYTGHETTVGEYVIPLKVTDSSFNTTRFELIVEVIDLIAPVIEGPEHIEYTPAEPATLEQLIGYHFTFYDDYDGVIEAYSVLEDDFTENETVFGEKTVTIEISDSSGNTAAKTFVIDIADTVAPVIHGPDALYLYLSETWTIEQILSLYTLEDDYTPSAEMTLTVLASDVPECFGETGTFAMVLQTSDEAGNVTDKHVNVTIEDDIPPHISGPRFIDTTYYELLTWEDLLAVLEYYDNYVDIDAEDVYALENTYVGNEAVIGAYRIVFAVTDGVSESIHVMYVRVRDDVPPVFTLDNRIVILEGTPLNSTLLLSLIAGLPVVAEFAPVHLRPLDGLTVDAPLPPGVHSLIVELINAHEETLIYTVDVEVVAREETAVNETDYRWRMAVVTGVSGLILIASFIGLKRIKRS